MSAPNCRRDLLFAFTLALASAIVACGAPSQSESATDAAPLQTSDIAAWNELVLRTAEAEDSFLTLKGLRTTAMMHLALHDAVTSRGADRRPLLNGTAPRAAADVDPVLASHRAAFEIARSSYPDQVQAFSDLFAAITGTAAEVPPASPAQRFGADVAKFVLDSRRGDGWDSEAEYQWHPMAPGVYAEFAEHSGTPEGFVFGSAWSKARPFTLPTAGHFRVPPPPAIESAEYTAAFDEVKAVGAANSERRTEDQAHLAMWWKDFAENSHNRLARQLVTERQLDAIDTARLFTLLNLAVYDAYLSSFDNKFHYNHWRPYTAIRWADNDGNPDTAVDRQWTNLHDHTYAFPSYPSAHGTACAAAMTVLADAFGEPFSFTMTTPEVDRAGPMAGKVAMDPPTRSFSSFDEAAVECADSRVYLGIHFRYDSEQGHLLGEQVGRQVLAWALATDG